MEITTKLFIFAPMKRDMKQDLTLFGLQILVWFLLMLAPAGVCYLIDPAGQRHWMFLFQAISLIGPMGVVYMINFYVLVPYLFFRNHKGGYLLAAFVLILLMNARWIPAAFMIPDAIARGGLITLLASSIAIHALSTLGAFGLRGYLRSHQIQRQLDEERRKSTEAELTWLKNQLNPHFLFNSLNNISSLTQIDPDQAQDAIGQLSDLLRYALYESNKPLVPLSGEAEFMHNYISLMKLRCSTSTIVEEEMMLDNASSMQIAPLLFISFIENAFKHGTSNNQPSKISIRLTAETKQLTFECRNTNFPKSDTDRSGSGVGLENTRRRLDLLYPDKYEWKQTLEDGFYSIRLTLNF